MMHPGRSDCGISARLRQQQECATWRTAYAEANRFKAYLSPSTESFREWQKREKDHWYHARLLQRIWPELMSVWRGASEQLSDLLGKDHDLAVFRQTMLDAPDRFDSELGLQTLIGLVDRRRAELQTHAQPLGQRLFAEKPNRLCSRMASYWDTWKAAADNEPHSQVKERTC